MDWTKVITEPMGLVGFALSLVFGVLSVRKGMPPWWPTAAMILAIVSVAGGIFLAFKKVDADTAKAEAAKAPATVSDSVHGGPAKSESSCSPVYSGVTVGGNMESNIDCSVQPYDKPNIKEK
ncbi:MAG: hypothetical protein H0U72_06540 [Nitrosospira sp.]|nr:hypothetical protein [Nitrosospira sp.]